MITEMDTDYIEAHMSSMPRIRRNIPHKRYEVLLERDQKYYNKIVHTNKTLKLKPFVIMEYDVGHKQCICSGCVSKRIEYKRHVKQDTQKLIKESTNDYFF